MKTVAVSMAALVFLSGSAYGLGPDIDQCLSTVSLADCSQNNINICPEGDTEMITDQCGGNGYISLTVVDAEMQGVPGIAVTDYWLESCNSSYDLILCGGLTADSLTNEDGKTTISGNIAGSGCVLDEGICIVVQGKHILQEPGCVEPTCLDFEIRSPDYIPDGIVDLSDFSSLISSWSFCSSQAGYNECFDFIDNDCIDLSDFAYFAMHWQHQCR